MKQSTNVMVEHQKVNSTCPMGTGLSDVGLDSLSNDPATRDSRSL
jgi:hypothetical protein